MKKYLVLLLSLSFLFMIGCESSTDPVDETNVESTKLVEYLEGDGGNYLNTTAPKIITASSVIIVLDDYKILDCNVLKNDV